MWINKSLGVRFWEWGVRVEIVGFVLSFDCLVWMESVFRYFRKGEILLYLLNVFFFLNVCAFVGREDINVDVNRILNLNFWFYF